MLNFAEYKNIQKECLNIAIIKSNDYGCGTMKTFMEKGLVIRMNDKMQRLINLVWDETEMKVQDEKIEDTALDLINYSTYLVMMLRKKLEEKSENK